MRVFVGVILTLSVIQAPQAWGQEWLLDDSLQALGRVERDRLLSGIKKAPQRALEDVLRQEAEHLEHLHKDELEDFSRQAWGRLLAGREEGRLWKAFKSELATAKVFTTDLLRKVWTEERKRLHTVRERVAYAMVDRAMRAVVIERLLDLRSARLAVARFESRGGDPRTLDPWGRFPLAQPDQVFAWRAVPRDAETDVSTKLPLPRVTFWSDEARFQKEVVKKHWKTKLGDVRVTAAEVVGLAEAKAGVVRYEDEFGRKMEGLGAHFTARARFTAARGAFASKEIGKVKDDLGIRARMFAMAHALKTAEVSAGAVISEKGFGTHNRIKAGAGSEARVHMPITIDLKVIRIRVIPYASAHVGVSAEAHANFEVEWTGKVRLDLGASVSKGVGFGAGVLIEIELGPVLRRYLERLVRRIERLVRPIGDWFMGRTWRGPPVPTRKLRITLEDMERNAETLELPTPPERTHAEVAARYAPVIYQRVKRGRYDLLRKVDYDGDWNTRNNFDNATPREQAHAHVYFDVKETATHYFVTYAFYHAGRKSNAIRPLRNLRRHENDMGGCIVVARKNATHGREVEVLITSDGSKTYTYSGLAPTAAGKRTRWKTRGGKWSGPVQFVDEATHPLFDLERTHPQVWINGKGHEVYGFTGRDDRAPFSGKEGVVYVPASESEAPESYRDHHVGYALLPMSHLLDRADDPETFTVDKQILANVAFRPLPRRFRGDEGPDDRAAPPWAWRVHRTNRDKERVVDEGVVFIDPARALDALFELPKQRFALGYTHNPWLKVPVKSDDETGLRGNLK